MTERSWVDDVVLAGVEAGRRFRRLEKIHEPPLFPKWSERDNAPCAFCGRWMRLSFEGKMRPHNDARHRGRPCPGGGMVVHPSDRSAARGNP